MQITYKRNGLKSYMIVKTEKVDSGSLREKMVVRNNIDYLARVNPQRIDGHICFYYDIRGRISIDSLFSGRKMKKGEIEAVLRGISGLLNELQRYLLSTDEVLFSPSCIWVLPDTLEPAFIYVPDMIPEDKYSIISLAEFLTEHVDGNDREAAALAYNYLEMVENGCFMPDMDTADITGSGTRTFSPSQPSNEREKTGVLPDPAEYWDIKEGIADEMKPFFTQTEKTVIASGRKKIAYALLGVVTVISACYIALVLNPALFPIHLTDDEYLASGIVIATAFAMVLIGVMLTCCRKTDDTDEELYPEDVSSFDKAVSGEDNLEYLEYEKLKADEENEKTVLLKRPVKTGSPRSYPVLKYADGRIIAIKTLPFIIGKMKNRVDGVIEGRGISRIHAILKESAGRYYISDLNSLNGTEINGRSLEADETAEITEGDIISFADTSLTFHTCAG